MSSDSPVGDPPADRVRRLDIQDEMRSSYLTYAMSVIIARALPDVRDGLKPSQRRILVAMNDLSLGPSSGRVKCAKITGDTSGNYHPHGSEALYLTLARLAQDWVMRQTLVDKQGNFGSLAGLPPAAQRYTEARLSAAATEMLRDLDRDSVDFVPTYDQRMTEPVVLPSRFPNLLVNGSSGIAVGMATSIPPHNMAEVCDGVAAVIDDPDITIDELMEYIPGPDFPTGGIIQGRVGIRQGYLTGRSTITLRARTHFETEKNTDVIVVTEIPYMETRDRVREKLEQLVKDERIDGIARVTDLTDRTNPPWQVRLHIAVRRDADKEIVLNQLFKYSPLQTTFSVIMLGLVGNRPATLNIKEIIQEFIRHRVVVIRRRTEFLLAEARRRKHTVEGLLIAQVDIDLVIRTIRESGSRALAKERLQEITVPAELVARALGDEGYRSFLSEKGLGETGNGNAVPEGFSLSPRQAEAIVSMQLGSLANLEREQLNGEHRRLLDEIGGHLRLLGSEANILAVIRDDMTELRSRFGDKRRTDISDEELGDVDRGDLIAEEPMVVTITRRGYIKRTALSTYQAQNRGGKGVRGTKLDEEDPLEHVFVSSTHDWLLFFTDHGKVFWQKVYDLPLLARTAKGRALVNLLSLGEEEKVSNCLPVREFPDDRYLMMATRAGLVKKTALSAYGRPLRGGIIAIQLTEGDALIDVRIVSGGDDVVLGTAAGMSIRFSHRDARPMGRNTRGVKGIGLTKGDTVVGMVVADPDQALLTVCSHGYGKRTPFGFIEDDGEESAAVDPALTNGAAVDDAVAEAEPEDETTDDADEGTGGGSNMRYRRQRRGGKGVRDIKTSSRNGPVVKLVAVDEADEVLMMTAGGKIQRFRASDIRMIGRNTQGVRLIRLDSNDRVAALARIPAELAGPAEREGEDPLSPDSDVTPEADTVPESGVAPEAAANPSVPPADDAPAE